ncbi:MAG: ABC transporter ATP-binding protein [Nitriliruptor sp.]|nr:MAG: ABC transporter ATP-binding protein [Nitriliruptor sp.]
MSSEQEHSSSSPTLVRAMGAAAAAAPALRRGLGGTILLAFLGTTGQVVVPIAIQQLIDGQALAGGPADAGGVVAAGGIALAVLAMTIWLNRIALRRMVTAAAHGLSELRIAAFRRIHHLSSLQVQAERRGVLVARVTSDVEVITQFLEWGGVGMLVGAAQILMVVMVMAIYDPVLAGLVVVAGTVYGLMLVVFQRILRRGYDRVRVLVGDSLGAMSEAISGLPTIRAYGAEELTAAKVDRALDRQYRAEVRTQSLGAGLFSTAELFAAAVTAGVVAFGVTGPTEITAGQLIAFLFLVTLFIEPVQLLVEVLNEAQTASAGLRRVLEVIESPDELPDAGDAGRDPPAGPLAVTFRDVGFRYPTGADVLTDLTLHLDAGRRYAIVGETGSGKSTIVKLLTRLLDPTRGDILLSGAALRQVPFRTLRRRVGFVPQDGFLWDTSLRENVRYGRPEATDDEVDAALGELGLASWIARLPRGIDTAVGERGGRLSAGERQLVALARASLAGPDLLVLDEATSAVDPALEVALRRAIERLTGGRTSVTVAHRLSTAEAADEVLVIDAGRLVQRGPHATLVQTDGVYARLHADWAAGTSR